MGVGVWMEGEVGMVGGAAAEGRGPSAKELGHDPLLHRVRCASAVCGMDRMGRVRARGAGGGAGGDAAEDVECAVKPRRLRGRLGARWRRALAAAATTIVWGEGREFRRAAVRSRGVGCCVCAESAVAMRAVAAERSLAFQRVSKIALAKKLGITVRECGLG